MMTYQRRRAGEQLASVEIVITGDHGGHVTIAYTDIYPMTTLVAFGQDNDWVQPGLRSLLLRCLLERPPLDEVEAALERLGVVRSRADLRMEK